MRGAPQKKTCESLSHHARTKFSTIDSRTRVLYYMYFRRRLIRTTRRRRPLLVAAGAHTAAVQSSQWLERPARAHVTSQVTQVSLARYSLLVTRALPPTPAPAQQPPSPATPGAGPMYAIVRIVSGRYGAQQRVTYINSGTIRICRPRQ